MLLYSDPLRVDVRVTGGRSVIVDITGRREAEQGVIPANDFGVMTVYQVLASLGLGAGCRVTAHRLEVFGLCAACVAGEA